MRLRSRSAPMALWRYFIGDRVLPRPGGWLTCCCNSSLSSVFVGDCVALRMLAAAVFSSVIFESPFKKGCHFGWETRVEVTSPRRLRQRPLNQRDCRLALHSRRLAACRSRAAVYKVVGNVVGNVDCS